jgi:hypothetical protein
MEPPKPHYSLKNPLDKAPGKILLDTPTTGLEPQPSPFRAKVPHLTKTLFLIDFFLI